MPTIVIRINTKPQDESSEDDLPFAFADQSMGFAQKRWSSFLVSVTLHAVIIAGLPYLPLFGNVKPPEQRRQVRVARIIRLNVPDDLFFHTPKPAERKGGGTTSAGTVNAGASTAGNSALPSSTQAPAAPAASSGSESSSSSVIEEPKAAARPYQFPPEVRRVEEEKTLLFPDMPPDVKPDKLPPMPPLAVWTATPRVKKPDPRKFVPPAESVRAPSIPVIEDTPVLDSANREPELASLKVASSIMTAEAKLQRPPANPAPVRAFAPPPTRRLDPSGAPLMDAPDARTFLSLSNAPIPRDGKLDFQSGNQVSQWHEQASGGSSGGKTGNTAADGGVGSGSKKNGTAASGAGPNTNRATSRGTGAGTGSNDGNGAELKGSGPQGASSSPAAGGTGFGGKGSGNALTGRGISPTAGTGNGSGPSASSSPLGNSREGSGSAGLGTGAGAGPGSADGIVLGGVTIPRIVFPSTEVHDIVVQSPSGDVLPEGVGYLSGRPVYTVFLPIGKPRKWIMQYCLPSVAKPREPTVASKEVRVVRLGAPAPLKAPYPMEAFEPPSIAGDGLRYWLVYGFLDAVGNIQELRLVNGIADRAKLIVQALQRWQFRPASQDGRAVRVEFLIAIPTGESQ